MESRLVYIKIRTMNRIADDVWVIPWAITWDSIGKPIAEDLKR